MIKILKEGKTKDFQTHVDLPKSEEQSINWQNSNRSWWEKNPMRYDFTEKIPFKEFTKEFYEEIDRRFFASVWEFMPWKDIPFDPLIDFNLLSNQNILEIGVGNGSHAQLLAQKAHSYTGIDITKYAVQSSGKRLDLLGCNGEIICMDAESMEFDDNTFDFIWSWGVIHHSSNTQKVLEEIYRVLRPGGKVITMVYHRSPWNTYVRGLLYYGILRGGLLKGKSLTEIIQDSTDGALARYYTINEWKATLSNLFNIEKNVVYGHKQQLIPLGHSKTKDFLISLIPNSLGRFITNRPFFGFHLVTIFYKKAI